MAGAGGASSPWSAGRGAPFSDQLSLIADLLIRDPESRRAVLQIWDAAADLGVASRDLACNTQAMFKIRDGRLHMTVSNRSNDMIWGCYGANAVHFSVLLEYMAARIGVAPGLYRQISDSFHAYEDTWPKVAEAGTRWQGDPYARGEVIPFALVADAASFDAELEAWLAEPPESLDFAAHAAELTSGRWKNPFLIAVATPLYRAWFAWKAKDFEAALRWSALCAAEDWRRAALEWLGRRQKPAGAAAEISRHQALARLAAQPAGILRRLAALAAGEEAAESQATGKAAESTGEPAGEPSAYLLWLEPVLKADQSALRAAEAGYGDSWKRRGGADSFAMLGRKWARIETALARRARKPGQPAQYDIFGHIAAAPEPGGLIDDIRDLRRYLMIIGAEAHLRAAEGIADSGRGYLQALAGLAARDLAVIREKQKAYGSSWKEAGGVRAFMMLARKWDRLVQRVGRDLRAENGSLLASEGNIFEHIAADSRTEGILSDLAGLRQYLLLCEAEMLARGALDDGPPPPEAGRG